MYNPLVSIIIPNYCHAKYLDQRIQSVLGQTYQNFEVIILDDCSPDNGESKAVIEKYRDNPHVSHIVYNEQNSGSTFKQWNKGFHLAKGEIIWIAESDDYCDLNFLETLIPCWERYPSCSVIETSLYMVDTYGNKMYPEIKYSGETVFYKGMDFIRKYMVKSNYHIPNASAVTFRKDVAFQVPKEYMAYVASGDRLFWIFMLELGDICKVFKPLSYFRQHLVKVTQKKEADGTQGRENYMRNKYLRRQGYIKRLVAADAFIFYWNYFQHHTFDSEEIRTELINLWFPWWQRNIFYRFYNKCLFFIYSKIDNLLGDT